MSKKQKIIAGGAMILVVTGVATFILWNRSESLSIERLDPSGEEKGIARETFEPLVGDVTVPDENQTEIPDNVAVPNTVKKSAPGVVARDREFAIAIFADAFIPDTVIVREGDVARITFTAHDKAYDIVQPDHGLHIMLLEEETKLMAAQFNRAGKYRFYCESCGGPENGPLGYLVVAQREE